MLDLLLRVVFVLFVIVWFLLGCVGFGVFLGYWCAQEKENDLGEQSAPRRSPVHVPESIPELSHAVPVRFFVDHSSRRVH